MELPERNKLLKVFGVDSKSWAMKYGLEPITKDCECGRRFETNIPCALGKLKGMMALTCECGNEDAPYVLGLPEGFL